MQDFFHRKLGMPRRDFLDGIALTAGAALTPQAMSGFENEDMAETSPDYYPPILTGMRELSIQ